MRSGSRQLLHLGALEGIAISIQPAVCLVPSTPRRICIHQAAQGKSLASAVLGYNFWCLARCVLLALLGMRAPPARLLLCAGQARASTVLTLHMYMASDRFGQRAPMRSKFRRGVCVCIGCGLDQLHSVCPCHVRLGYTCILRHLV